MLEERITAPVRQSSRATRKGVFRSPVASYIAPEKVETFFELTAFRET